MNIISIEDWTHSNQIIAYNLWRDLKSLEFTLHIRTSLSFFINPFISIYHNSSPRHNHNRFSGMLSERFLIPLQYLSGISPPPIGIIEEALVVYKYFIRITNFFLNFENIPDGLQVLHISIKNKYGLCNQVIPRSNLLYRKFCWYF